MSNQIILSVSDWEKKFEPLSFEELKEKYPHLTNRNVDDGDHGDAIFETWKDETERLEKVAAELATEEKTKGFHVWTFCDTEEHPELSARGVAYMNGYAQGRIYYVVTKQPWTVGDEFFIHLELD